MLTSSNAKVLKEATKAIQASQQTISETTATIKKPHQEVTMFMNDFITSSNKNTANMNKVIKGFLNSLKDEKEAHSLILSDIKVENVELTSSIVSKIEKLQEELAAENKIMDELTEKTQKAKVFSVKLKSATKDIVDLEDERTIVKS